MIGELRRQTARGCGSPCGGPCTSRSIRRRMCSKTRLACGWRLRTTAGAAVRTWTSTPRAAPEHPSWPVLASSRIWSWNRLVTARQPVRHPRSRPGHLRATQAGDRVRPAGVRNRPASSSGPEAAAPDRARLRHPRVAAAGAGRLRGGPVLVGPAGDRWLRCRPAGGRGLHRRRHVPHQGRDRGHATPDRSARHGLHAGHDVHAAAPARRTRGAPRTPGNGEICASSRGTPCISFFSPPEMLALAHEAGFREARHVSAGGLTQRYFAGRTDGLRPSSSEELLVATT